MSYRLLLVALGLLLGALGVAGLLWGHGSLSEPATRAVFLELRATRFAAAALAGAALAMAGTLTQGLFRNPLAEPSVLGVTAGAGLGARLALLLHGALLAGLPGWLVPEMLLPLGCLLGAGAGLAVLLAVAGRDPGLLGILLAGFILGSLFASLGAFIISLAQDSWELGRAMVAFSLGGVDGKGARHLLLAAPLVAIGGLAAWGWGRPLDLMLSGAEEAAAMGVDVAAVRRWTLVWTAVLVAAAVAVGGGVGFVGLVVPHALRPFTGPAHRRLLPAAALGGAAFLVACDLVARSLPAIGDIPLGVVTGLIGAPLFLALLARMRRTEAA